MDPIIWVGPSVGVRVGAEREPPPCLLPSPCVEPLPRLPAAQAPCRRSEERGRRRDVSCALRAARSSSALALRRWGRRLQRGANARGAGVSVSQLVLPHPTSVLGRFAVRACRARCCCEVAVQLSPVGGLSGWQ